MMPHVPSALHTDQLFVNGKLQILTRYPNYDPSAAYFDGWSPDAFSTERGARWKDPRGGFIHAMHHSAAIALRAHDAGGLTGDQKIAGEIDFECEPPLVHGHVNQRIKAAQCRRP